LNSRNVATGYPNLSSLPFVLQEKIPASSITSMVSVQHSALITSREIGILYELGY
jgi:hypothetical protein